MMIENRSNEYQYYNDYDSMSFYQYYALSGVLSDASATLIYDLASIISSDDYFYRKPLLYFPHITIVGGLDAANPDGMRGFLPSEIVDIEATKTHVFKSKGQRCEILSILEESASLKNLNASILNHFGHNIEVDYMPHISLAFLNEGAAQKYAGIDFNLTGKLSISNFIFSNHANEGFELTHNGSSSITLIRDSHPRAWADADPVLEGNRLFLSKVPFRKIEIRSSTYPRPPGRYVVALTGGASWVRDLCFECLKLEDAKYYLKFLKNWYFRTSDHTVELPSNRLFTMYGEVEKTDEHGQIFIVDTLHHSPRLLERSLTL